MFHICNSLGTFNMRTNNTGKRRADFNDFIACDRITHCFGVGFEPFIQFFSGALSLQPYRWHFNAVLIFVFLCIFVIFEHAQINIGTKSER